MDIKKSIEQFLPKYLSPKDQRELLKCLEDFPDNLNSRFYSQHLRDENYIFQGDGFRDLPVIDLPNKTIQYSNCIITSNTCDLDINNKRLAPTRITYAPIINLNKYIGLLVNSDIDKDRIQNHIAAIKKQEVTQIFYLPEIKGMNESIVYFDRINNCSNKIISKENITDKRIYTLSNYGFYLFLLKLSISFTRIQEGVNRV